MDTLIRAEADAALYLLANFHEANFVCGDNDFSPSYIAQD